MKLVVLEQVRIESPCMQSWKGMTGGDQKRFCTSCDKHVHDLTALSRAEGEKLLAGSEHVCIRMTCDSKGRVITADDLPFARVRRILRKSRLYWVYGLAAVVISFVGACGRAAVMGDVAAPKPSCPPDAKQTMGKPAPPATQPTPPEYKMGIVAMPPQKPPTTQPGDAAGN